MEHHRGMPLRRPALVAALALAAIALGVALAVRSGGDSTPRPAPDPFLRGPYLTRVTQTTARLRWIVSEGARVSVEARAPDGTRARARGGVLAGLRPDTRYRWTASVDGAPAASGTLTTAPARLSRPLDLIVFGDYGAPNADWRAVAAMAGAERPRLMVTTGDNSYLVAAPELLDGNIFRPLREALAHGPDYGVVGDHDVVLPRGQAALVEALDWPGEGQRYELRYGPVQIVALGLREDPGDAAFAARALARPGPEARLVVVHQPIKAGSELLPVIARAGVTAVLAGHLHAYERRELAGAPGVPFLTVGTGGASRNENATPRSPDARVHIREFGLLRMRLEPGRATYAFVNLAGKVRDRLVAPLVP
jgi:hypothetical protein